MDPCSKPNLLLAAKFFLFLFPLFYLSPKHVSAADANAPSVMILGKNASVNVNVPLPQLVNDFCNDERVKKAFCVQVFGSDPRSSKVFDRVALAKIGMEQTQSNMEKIVQELSSQMGNPTIPSSLKPILKTCVDDYNGLMSSFKYYFNLAASGVDEGDYMMTWDYDITLAGDRVINCQKELSSTVPRDESLVKKSELAVQYYDIGFTATGIMASLLPRPR